LSIDDDTRIYLTTAMEEFKQNFSEGRHPENGAKNRPKAVSLYCESVMVLLSGNTLHYSIGYKIFQLMEQYSFMMVDPAVRIHQGQYFFVLAPRDNVIVDGFFYSLG